MTLAELDSRMGMGELAIWKAHAQVEDWLQSRQNRLKVGRAQALEHARAEHRSVMARKHQRKQHG